MNGAVSSADGLFFFDVASAEVAVVCWMGAPSAAGLFFGNVSAEVAVVDCASEIGRISSTTSLREAVDKLNSGDIGCLAGMILVFSQSKRQRRIRERLSAFARKPG